jgi:hypothetical protein
MSSLIFAFLLTAASANTDGALNSLVPSDAQSVRTLKLDGGSQVEFRVRRARDQLGVSTVSLDRLRSDGWALCAAPMAEKWDELTENDGAGQVRRVEQRVSYLRRKNWLIAINERYEGRSKDVAELRRVILIEAAVKPDEAAQIIESARLRCDKAG